MLKKIGFQFTLAQTDLDIYIYHSSKTEAIHTFKLTTTTPVDWNWVTEEFDLIAEGPDYSGGSYVIGYYQDDIEGQAINFENFNWRNGPCNTCDGGLQSQHWTKFHEYASVLPVYVPSASLDPGRKVFDFRDTIVTHELSYGMNLRISAECDLTNFLCEHRYSLKKALALKVAYLILKDMSFSQEINSIEENLKSLIIRDLEGDKDTNYVNIIDQLEEEIKAVNFDHSGLAVPCLPCDNSKSAKYGVV